MAGLLDYLSAPNAGNGIGGLLSYLNSPLYMPPAAAPAPQPQYDAMGNYTGITPDAPNPFGPIPQMSLPKPEQFQLPSVFNGGVAAAPVAGLPSLGSQGPAPQPVVAQSAPQPQPQSDNSISVGGYQMPRIGSPDEFLPQQAMTPQNATPTQGQMPAPMPSGGALPPALEGPSVLGRLFNPNGLIAKLTGNDTRSLAQQNLRAQYEALVPIVGRQKAMFAVMNPEAGKTILAQALEKKNYGFTKLDNDTLLRTDPLTGKAEIAYGGGDDRGTITGPDGKQIPIPPGVDRKTFVNEISRATADATTGKKTEVQGAAEQFANRMENAEKSFGKVSNEGLGLSGATQNMTGSLPGVGNFLKTENFQKMEQAKREWVTALLRKESGAAIGKDEYTQYDRQFFPQPGDGPGVAAQKAEARRVAMEAMKKTAGPSYKSPEGVGPTVGSVQQGYRFKGGNPADRNSWERVQ
jgi:hypothetical protein